ncbi:MAG: GAF domain-containing protein [Anaerolineae bacterium]|nr:GAF domain-containing protein [Anaerolineae bacterium]
MTMSTPEAISLFRVRLARRVLDAGPTTYQRAIAIGVWLIAVAATLVVVREVDWYDQWLDPAILFFLYLLPILLSIRLPGGIYVGFIAGGVVTIALATGYERAMPVIMAGSLAVAVSCMVLVRLLHLPHVYQDIFLYESLYNSAVHSLSVFLVGYSCRMLGCSIPLDILVKPQSLPGFVFAAGIYSTLIVAGAYIWLASGGASSVSRLTRHWHLFLLVNYAGLVVVPLFVFILSYNDLRWYGLALYVLGQAGLYGLSVIYIDLSGRNSNLSLLNSIGQALSTNLEIDELLATLRREIGKLLDVSGFILAFYDEQTRLISFLVDYEDGRPVHFDPVGIDDRTVMAHVIRTRQTLLLNRVTPAIMTGLEIKPVGRLPRSFLGVPVWAGDQIIGAMGLRNYQREHAFTHDDRHLLEAIAMQAGVALQNARLYQHSQRQSGELTSLNRLSSLTTSTLDLDHLIHTVCTVIVEIMGYDKAAVFLLDEDGAHAHMANGVGLSRQFKSISEAIALTHLQTDVCWARSPIVIEDLSDGCRFENFLWMADADQIRAVLEVPLKIGDRIIGSLLGCYTQAHHIPRSEIEMMETLAGQIAAAVENARLFEATRARSRELETLYRASSAISSSLSLKHVLKTLSANLIETLGISGCATWLADEDGASLRAELKVIAGRKGPRERSFKPLVLIIEDIPLVARAIEQHDVCLLRYDDPALGISEHLLLDHSSVKDGLALPLLVGNRLVGLMVMPTFAEAGGFTPQQARLAESLTNQAAVAIENARLFERTDVALAHRLNEIAAIEQVAQRMTSQLEMRGVIKQVVKAAVEATGADYADIGLLDEQTNTLHLIIRHDPDEDVSQHLPAGQGVVGRVLQTNSVVNIGDVLNDPDYIRLRRHVRSELAAPIMLKGKHLGVINLESVHLNAFTPDHARFVANLAEHAAIAIANARLFEAVQQQVKDFRTLRSIALELLTSPDLGHSLRLIINSTVSQVGAAGSVICLYDQANDSLTFGASRWMSGECDQTILAPGLTDLMLSVARSADKLVVDDPAAHSCFVGPAGESIKTLVGMPLKLGNEIVGIFVVVFTDGTLLKEETLNFLDLLAAQSAAAIGNALLSERTRISRDRLQAVLDSSHDGILMFGMDSRLEIANPRVEYLLNLNIKDYVGLPVLDIVRCVRRDFPRDDVIVSLYKTRTLMRQIQQDPFAVTRRTYTIGGPSPHAIEETSMAVAGQDGTLIGRLFVLRDITQEIELESFREEMSHMIVHDLRSPLAGVITGLDMALEEIEITPEHPSADVLQSTLKVAYDNSRALLKLIEAILDVNKLESGEVPLVLETTSLESIARGACAKLQGLADDARIAIHIDAPESLSEIAVDVEKIERVFVNLLDNALKYTPQDGRIDIVIEAQATHQKVSIIDSGNGIPTDYRERIFDRFIQVSKSARKRGPKGTGLGLTFCRLAIEAHRGRIWVGEGPTGGAAFHFTLPVEWVPQVSTKT